MVQTLTVFTFGVILTFSLGCFCVVGTVKVVKALSR